MPLKIMSSATSQAASSGDGSGEVLVGAGNVEKAGVPAPDVLLPYDDTCKSVEALCVGSLYNKANPHHGST